MEFLAEEPRVVPLPLAWMDDGVRECQDACLMLLLLPPLLSVCDFSDVVVQLGTGRTVGVKDEDEVVEVCC